MTDLDPGMLGRIQSLENQVKKLTTLIEVLSRYDGKDESLTDTRLNDDKQKKKKEPSIVPTGDFAAEYEPTEEYYSTLGRLTLGIAHDVNNLISIMVGYCELMAEGLSEEDPRREFTVSIADLGQQAGEMIHYLTDSADRTANENYDRVIVSELFQKLGRLLPRYVGTNYYVDLECQTGSQAVPLDRMQAIRLVLNLVGNARAATPPGGRINVRAMRKAVDRRRVGFPDVVPVGNYAVLKVSDTGTGMSDEVLKRMFQMHYSTRGEAGSGIGLSVVRGIVHDAGGFIQVESAPGTGTQLRVFLPV
jgi:signal transduction histidine kinase